MSADEKEIMFKMAPKACLRFEIKKWLDKNTPGWKIWTDPNYGTPHKVNILDPILYFKDEKDLAYFILRWD